ncbi:hypothetical protein K1718_13180 [Roseibium porphyridii]|uniref:Endonuclease/exonuclease/phosphatase domain-containing protein n=1 Tax=Roseibium porphyridii TaxID=2866279 RepID=A0ABY8F9Y7_9HYPH|nr:endonuclease/exonuclease/phosphatase family protein [Roseibium sp. KMA01]WFE92272.1 hypothetical protein K1718_13180 [Roseibium sp. KMA01]
MRSLIPIVFLAAISTSAAGQELIVGTLNAESASDTNEIAVSQVIRDAGFVDVWAFQEVEDLEALTEYTVAAGAVGGRKSFRRELSTSGEIGSQHRKNDHLGIVYNSSRLRHVETVELHGVRSRPGTGRLGDPDWGLRGVLFMRFFDRDTSTEFYVGNVHLKCCGDGKDTRAHQAEIIKQWIERSDVPVILTGDFNIPVEPGSTDGNTSSDAFQTLASVSKWLAPSNPVKTQCSDRFDSMLDLFFLTENADIEPIDVKILNSAPAYCDAEKSGGPDHRPVLARFAL